MDINYKETQPIDKQILKEAEKGYINYRSSEMPTWCPGCGYFGITKALQESFDILKIENHNLALVSGIGCAGRFPFFMNTYGIHSIHGRALPVATGIKSGNDKLNVVVLSGDGDTLSIGISHFIHGIRKNIDLTYILFDNSIYGLTKGQTSPSSPLGFKTKTSPQGNPYPPINPMLIALTSGVKFAARSFAANVSQMREIIVKAMKFKGFSFVHIYSPCVTFDHQYIQYKEFSKKVYPIEENYNPKDINIALTRAQTDIYATGILYLNKD